jgi:hypothetical protein
MISEEKEREEKVSCEAQTHKGTKCLFNTQVSFMEVKSCMNYEDNDYLTQEPIKEIPVEDILIIDVNGRKECHSMSMTLAQVNLDSLKKLYEYDTEENEPVDLDQPIFVLAPQYYVYLHEFKTLLNDTDVNYIKLEKMGRLILGSQIGDEEDSEGAYISRMHGTEGDVYLAKVSLKFNDECKNYCLIHFKEWYKKISKNKRLVIVTKYEIIKTEGGEVTELIVKDPYSNLSHFSAASNHDDEVNESYQINDLIKYYIKNKQLESIIIGDSLSILFFDQDYSNKNDLCAKEYVLNDDNKCSRTRIIYDVLDVVRALNYPFYIKTKNLGTITVMLEEEKLSISCYSLNQIEKIIEKITEYKSFFDGISVNTKNPKSFLRKFINYFLKRKLLIHIKNKNDYYVPNETNEPKRKQKEEIQEPRKSLRIMRKKNL